MVGSSNIMRLRLDLLTRSFLPSPDSAISNALGTCSSIWHVVARDTQLAIEQIQFNQEIVLGFWIAMFCIRKQSAYTLYKEVKPYL
jgi:hypothetical protein